MAPVLALTLDLDDTLWPIWPAIARAETVLHAWLSRAAPATARRFDVAGLRGLRERVAHEHPEWSHDLTQLRLESLRLALHDAGDDPALAVPAFEVFYAERQKVDVFADVEPALDRLAARFPLVALSNGNADLGVVGLARWFADSVTARSFGVGKPDPRIFHEACRRAGAAADRVLHIGDDLALDVQGALGAGLQAAWVVRPEVHPAPEAAPAGTHHVVTDLLQLAERLGA
ncbi:HAD family hydrolase [Caldimonas brevitalea]|uniref:HAD family hydrolase n=1 Tax=Caldimonas brevitalea TaxID=413882 RepID=A0A0G3BGQ3_9BURK|nr:HAD-IA family hydrolase [Caldimonas brevitalea]AKJ28629.1 HAD family hydrolase [Caldimonas brevitalea]